MISTEATEAEQDLSNLRFAYGKTAFDSDIDNLSEKPWRKPRVDLSDFFNYGFTEATWKVKLYFYTLVFIHAVRILIV